MRSLPDIFKLFIYEPTGDTNYYYSPNVLIADNALFTEVEFDSVKFDQTRNSTSLGTSYTKKFDFEFGDISQAIDLDNSVLLFTDTNGNSWLTGHEKPYSLNTSSKSIDDKSNTIEVSLEQTSYNELEPVTKFWFDNATSIDFPRGGTGNTVSGFTGVTGGSIILSWFNKPYTVPYESFKLVRTNPQGHSSGLTTNISINDINATGYTDTPDYYFGGTYKYKIALAQNLNGSDPFQYSNEISIDTVNPNIPLLLTGTTPLNNVVLTWTNPLGGYKLPYQSFSIIRSNFAGHPSGDTNMFFASSGSTGYTDVNVGATGLYTYKVAIAEGLSGSTPNQYSNIASFNITNHNIASGLTATTSGNSIILNWSNPDGGYTYDVQSFAINRCEVVEGLETNCQVLTFNNDGSATEYVDLNIGQTAGTGKTYSYQLATAKLPDGFDRQEFSEFSNDVTIASVNEPPNVGIVGSSVTKYYGSWIVTPQVQVSGGTGSITLYWYDTLNGGFIGNYSDVIALSGGTTPFTVALNPKQRDRAFGITYDWDIDLSGVTGYNIVGNTPIDLELPKRLVSPISTLTPVQNVGDVDLSWSTIASDTGTTTIYGYVINRYVTGDFGNTNTVIGYVASGTTTFKDVAPSPNNYTYYVRGASLNGNSTSLTTSDASPQEPITVT